jgi:hypothetical protein
MRLAAWVRCAALVLAGLCLVVSSQVEAGDEKPPAPAWERVVYELPKRDAKTAARSAPAVRKLVLTTEKDGELTPTDGAVQRGT